MHARMIQLTVKPGQFEEFVKTMKEKNLSILKRQEGMVDAVALTPDTERDQFVGLSFWKSEQDAERHMNGQGRDVVEAMKPFLRQEPTFRTFHVEDTTWRDIRASRAAR